MDRDLRFDHPRAERWRAGDSWLVGSLLLVALLGLLPGRATAGSGVPAATGPAPAPAPAATAPAAGVHASHDGLAALQREAASGEVHYVAGWVARTSDNQAQPYIIIDKVDARVYVFDAAGRLQGTAPALLGMVQGDGSAVGVGNRALSAIGPSDRTTPAGRFAASLGRDLKGQDILWVDYETSLALHRVVKGTPAERRAQRLESATALDNRISYGCINIPVAFYEAFVRPAFTHSSGVVYILPEMSTASEMFKPEGAASAAESVRSAL